MKKWRTATWTSTLNEIGYPTISYNIVIYKPYMNPSTRKGECQNGNVLFLCGDYRQPGSRTRDFTLWTSSRRNNRRLNFRYLSQIMTYGDFRPSTNNTTVSTVCVLVYYFLKSPNVVFFKLIVST